MRRGPLVRVLHALAARSVPVCWSSQSRTNRGVRSGIPSARARSPIPVWAGELGWPGRSHSPVRGHLELAGEAPHSANFPNFPQARAGEAAE